MLGVANNWAAEELSITGKLQTGLGDPVLVLVLASENVGAHAHIHSPKNCGCQLYNQRTTISSLISLLPNFLGILVFSWSCG